MRRALIAAFFLIASCAFGQNRLRDAARQDGSFAWKIRTDGVSICCCEGSTWTERKNYIEYSEIFLVAHVEAGRIERLRMVEPACPITVRILENVSAEASLEFLRDHLDDDKHVITAFAMHDHPSVIPDLITMARRNPSTGIRREAIFWLGQRAGEKAAGELRRAVDEDPEDEVRERAVFAIAQLPKERAIPMLTELVKTHKRPIVRKRAIFWLAQTGDPRALEVIEEILGVK
ncbi:MAG TPA: HEAT repeat domain-containing protein [Thermoanaerobaculia bacterium]|nr:HEAT repeat domain-containing protein [Thermoanaerobaculia bacterium]